MPLACVFDFTATARRQRASAAFTLVATAALLSSCATQPMGDNKGKPIFESFQQCMVANGVGAVVIGVLANKLTGSKAVGVAAAAVTLFAAWKACGQAHQKVTVKDERGRDALLGSDPRFRGQGGAVLTLDELEVSAPKAGEDITSRYRFAYTSPDAARKDIPAKERFVYMAGFTNDKGAQEFKEVEFQRDFVIQQGQRRHEHAVPSDASFGQFKPWKLRYQLEVDGRCLETEASFDVGSNTPGRAGPARPCTSATAAGAAPAPAATGAKGMATAPSAAPAANTAPTAAAAPAAEATLVRALRLQDKPGGVLVGKNLPKGTPVRIIDTSQLKTGARPVDWVRVQPVNGEPGGWTPDSNLKR